MSQTLPANHTAVRRGKIGVLIVNGKFTHVGRVGTGSGQQKVKTLLSKLKPLESKDSPFEGKSAPPAAPNIHWVKPKLVAEIEFAGWTGDGNVRQAAFKGLREDKAPGEITTETAKPAEEAEKHAASRKRARGAKKSGDRAPRSVTRVAAKRPRAPQTASWRSSTAGAVRGAASTVARQS